MGRRGIAVSIGLALLGGAATPAKATPEMLARSASNILLAPVDLVLAPVVAGHSIYTNLQASEDSTAVKVAFVLPGFAWNTGVIAFSSLLRELAGLLELLPGLALVGSERAPEPLFDAVERSDALLEWETPVLPLKVGVDYTSG